MYVYMYIHTLVLVLVEACVQWNNELEPVLCPGKYNCLINPFTSDVFTSQ